MAYMCGGLSFWSLQDSGGWNDLHVWRSFGLVFARQWWVEWPTCVEVFHSSLCKTVVGGIAYMCGGLSFWSLQAVVGGMAYMCGGLSFLSLQDSGGWNGLHVWRSFVLVFASSGGWNGLHVWRSFGLVFASSGGWNGLHVWRSLMKFIKLLSHFLMLSFHHICILTWLHKTVVELGQRSRGEGTRAETSVSSFPTIAVLITTKNVLDEVKVITSKFTETWGRWV